MLSSVEHDKSFKTSDQMSGMHTLINTVDGIILSEF